MPFLSNTMLLLTNSMVVLELMLTTMDPLLITNKALMLTTMDPLLITGKPLLLVLLLVGYLELLLVLLALLLVLLLVGHLELLLLLLALLLVLLQLLSIPLNSVTKHLSRDFLISNTAKCATSLATLGSKVMAASLNARHGECPK